MAREEIRAQVIRALEKQNHVTVSELADRTYTSESTIRRLLKEMEAEGELVRTRGGASLIRPDSIERGMHYRYGAHIQEKRKIAIAAEKLIEDGQRIMMDSSSTALIFAEQIRHHKYMDILTNGLRTAVQLSEIMDSTTNLYCACGHIHTEASGVYGGATTDFIRKHQADLAFLSGRGLDDRVGVSDSRDEEAEIKQAMAKSADKVVVLIDSSKVGKSNFFASLGFDQIDILITDKALPQSIADRLTSNDVHVIVAK
ncbi:DeoR/GlpR family DNA-binding transcription regulator [Lacticaseibacillus hegangensis]|uniref:DeoR/GlpR family DNA-binding transcription regulator n=1 Tax=Lacticaseibacillus hegangensis TaxID=2486010 RepID=A0ABW4CYZ1_9LACO|nr:DeoR/GlpR family DNA-binding transcription regulator [Lacticaseibacillus hegangensis]